MYYDTRRIVIALSALVFVFSVMAEEQHPAVVKFTINQYIIEGNTKVLSKTIETALTDYVGPDKDFATIQAAVSVIRKVYQAAGYEMVKVFVPKQELENGVVRLQVVEAQLAKVDVHGNHFYDTENILNTLPSLKAGEVVNIGHLTDDLRLANESNTKQTQVAFRIGDDPKQVNANVNVVDEKPWHLATSMDNTGTDQTGNFRLGMAFMHANVLNLDHMLSGYYVTSPDRWSDVQIFGLNYRIPLHGIGSEFELIGSHSSVNSGIVNTTAGTYGISGSGDSLGGHYIYLLPQIMNLEHRINLGFDYRLYQNNVVFQGNSGESLVPNTETHPISIAYSGIYKQPSHEAGYVISVSQNIPGGGLGSTSQFQLARHAAVADYTVMRGSLSFTWNLPMSWQFHTELSGQFTNNALISGEQFGIGGINSVRGFQERSQSNDKGQRGAVELYTPELEHLFEVGAIKVKALAFYNFANAWRNDALPGEIQHDHLSSVGIGFRGTVFKSLFMRLDMADILDTGSVGNTGHKNYQASLIYMY